MFIKRDEYERLVDSDQIRQNLEEEVQRLAEQISAEVKDCKIGPWCKRCKHLGKDNADLHKELTFFGYPYVTQEAGRVTYCRKHLHEICQEFELASN